MNIVWGHLEDPEFNLIKWYGAELLKTDLWKLQEVLSSHSCQKQIESQGRVSAPIKEPEEALDLASIQVDCQKYPHLQQNAASVKGEMQVLPKPIVLQVRINRQPARALMDSGLLGDFMSSTLADQLKVQRKILNTLLGLQLAVQGSHSKINTTTEARIQYQERDTTWHFDIINLNSYDIILGMLWLYQHSVQCVYWVESS